MARRAVSTTGRIKKSIGGTKAGPPSRRGSATRSEASGSSFSANSMNTLLTFWYGRPVIRYAAYGLGLFAFGKFAMRFSESYPQVSTFLRDHLEVVENKLSEFRGDRSEGDIADVGDEARH